MTVATVVRPWTALLMMAVFLNGCATGPGPASQGQIQDLTIPGVRFVDGKFRAQKGFHFVVDKTTRRTLLMRRGSTEPVAQIKPCSCVLLEGVCNQGLTTDPDNDDQITDVWCEGCGICLGGLDAIDGSLSLSVNFVNGGQRSRCP